MRDKKKRFVVKEEQSLGFGAVQIVVDTETGVNYLLTIDTGVSGLTPLLDRNGAVVIDTVLPE
ncbi:MAG TPA: hypothetical protein IAB47_04205 [Candidatus Scatomorpha merdigallinarum]|nr:hypothetical protein [Candidatus Scatomorpha merdigallinarum]